MYFFNVFDSFAEGSFCYFRGKHPIKCYASSPGLSLSHRNTEGAWRVSFWVVNFRGLHISHATNFQRWIVKVGD